MGANGNAAQLSLVAAAAHNFPRVKSRP